MLDTKALAAAMAPVIREAVDKAVAAVEGPLLKRIEDLEKRAPEKGEPGQNGADGKDAEPVTDEQIAAAVEAYMAANPPADGRDGADGKDGEPGEPGAPGEKGLDGKDGADGVGLAGAVIDRNGELVITLTNGEAKALGPVVGKDGRDGANGERGEAGFSLKDFDTEFRHDDKVLVLKFDGGDTLETHEIFLPYVRDCGVWKDGAEYLQGDGVTWGGSFWTAQKDTTTKPDGSSDWRLAVKKGRDGKDFAGPQTKTLDKVRV